MRRVVVVACRSCRSFSSEGGAGPSSSVRTSKNRLLLAAGIGAIGVGCAGIGGALLTRRIFEEVDSKGFSKRIRSSGSGFRAKDGEKVLVFVRVVTLDNSSEPVSLTKEIVMGKSDTVVVDDGTEEIFMKYVRQALPEMTIGEQSMLIVKTQDGKRLILDVTLSTVLE